MSKTWTITDRDTLAADNWAPFIDDDHVALTIDLEERTLTLEGRLPTNTTGTTASEWHNVTPVIRLTTTLLGSGYVTFLESDDTRALLARIAAGHTIDYANGTWRGHYTDDAEEAHYELQALADEWGRHPAVSAWEAREWLNADSGWLEAPTADTTDEELETLADTLIADARADSVHLNRHDLCTTLLSIRDDARTALAASEGQP